MPALFHGPLTEILLTLSTEILYSSDSMSRTVSDLIEDFGGIAAYASVIDKGYSTASEQKRSGRIPTSYWPAIIVAARKRRLSWVTAEALMAMQAQTEAAE